MWNDGGTLHQPTCRSDQSGQGVRAMAEGAGEEHMVGTGAGAAMGAGTGSHVDTAEDPGHGVLPRPGLRERKKKERRARVLAAASRLFAERGYEGVTTSEIAAVADVGVGTLFRHTGTKAELLVEVMNQRIAEGMEEGLERARQGRTVQESILAILEPLAEESLAHPGNMVAYEKEVLFGSEEGRTSSTARISQVEAAIVEVLRLHGSRPRNARIAVEDVAHTIYATLFLDIIKALVGTAAPEDLPERVRRSVDMLVGALLEP